MCKNGNILLDMIKLYVYEVADDDDHDGDDDDDDDDRDIFGIIAHKY